jgi:hypothetical protein
MNIDGGQKRGYGEGGAHFSTLLIFLSTIVNTIIQIFAAIQSLFFKSCKNRYRKSVKNIN